MNLNNELPIKIKMLEEEILNKNLELNQLELTLYQNNGSINDPSFCNNIMCQINNLTNIINQQKMRNKLNFEEIIEQINNIKNMINK